MTEATIPHQTDFPTDHEADHPSKHYFSVTIESELVRTFKLLFKYFYHLLKNPDSVKFLYTEEKRGNPDEKVLSIINKFKLLKQDLEKRGIEIPYNYLRYRFIAEDDHLTVNAIVQNTIASGGKDPNSKKTWIHVAGSTNQLSEFMHRYTGKSGVILLYDETKLTAITEEDIRAFPNEAYYYGMKPKDGLTLNDALLGMIIIST